MKTQVILIANAALETPHYRIRRVRDDQVELPENTGTSYALAEMDVDLEAPPVIQDKKPVEQAAIVTVTAASPVPVPKPQEKKGPGMLARFLSLFQGQTEQDPGKSDRDKRRHSTDSRRRGGRQPDRHDDARRRGSERDRPSRKKKSDRQPSAKPQGDDAARQQRNQERKKPQDVRRDQEVRRDPQVDEQGARRDEGRDSGREVGRDDSRKKSGKRRSRGGRRRRKNTENADVAARPEQQQGAALQDPQADFQPKPLPQQPTRTNGQSRESSRESLREDMRESFSDSIPEERFEDAKPVSVAANVAVPTIAAVSVTSAIDYEDTQPELPLIREPYEHPPVVESARFVAPPEPAAYRPEPETEAVRAAEPVAAVKVKPESSAPTEGAVAEARPQGRLLPWEPPVAPVEKAAPLDQVQQESPDDRDATS